MLLRIFLLLCCGLITLSCQKGITLGPGSDDLLASEAETSCGFIQNIYGQRVSWKNNLPTALTVHKSFPPEFLPVLEDAVAHWNNAAGKTLIRLIQGANNLSQTPQKESINTIHWLRSWEPSKKFQQGVTSIYWTGNQIREADISINAQDFNFFTDQPTTPYDVHLESLLVHELGHVLGLKHWDIVPSVMWPVLNGAAVRNILTSADRNNLQCEY